MDELERVIGDACWAKWGDGPWGSAAEQAECQANAVRTYLESSEVVERVATAIGETPLTPGALIGADWRAWEQEARAALQAAGGNQDGR